MVWNVAEYFGRNQSQKNLFNVTKLSTKLQNLPATKMAYLYTTKSKIKNPTTHQTYEPYLPDQFMSQFRFGSTP